MPSKDGVGDWHLHTCFGVLLPLCTCVCARVGVDAIVGKTIVGTNVGEWYEEWDERRAEGREGRMSYGLLLLVHAIERQALHRLRLA